MLKNKLIAVLKRFEKAFEKKACKFIPSEYQWRFFPIDRAVRMVHDRIRYGYDESDLWSLDDTIAKFVLPRLKDFRANAGSYPDSLDSAKEWEDILDKMIYSFEYHASDRKYSFDPKDIEDRVKAKEGLKLFAEYFGHLWT